MLYFISIPPNIATYFTFTFGIFSISLFFLKENPPKIGDIVTFKYYGLTKNNKPKFASFLRVRKEE